MSRSPLKLDELPAAQLKRRDALHVGVVGLGGLTLPALLRLQNVASRAAETGARPPKARSVILLYLSGGPSQLETWDPKPQAPVEVRGTSVPVDSNVAGVQICEYLPRMARLADKYAIIRSMSHKVRGHPMANHFMMTGSPLPRDRRAKLRSLSREDSPHLGSVLGRMLGARGGMPPFVLLPQTIQPTGPTDPHPGQFAGFLGPRYDPYMIDADPNLPDYTPGPLQLSADVSIERLRGRRHLLQQAAQRAKHVGAAMAAGEFAVYYEKALDLVSSPAAQKAFDVDAEPERVRDRYGRHSFGQSALLARRLIEAGVRLVHVNWIRIDNGKGGQGYDSHRDHLRWARQRLSPPTDSAFSSLVEDLDERGLLKETLVVLMGEFGRTPRFNKNAGRDHWPDCFSLVLAGGGIRGGQVYGSSDSVAAYPHSNPVSPQDLFATVYRLLGVDPHDRIYDQLERPHPLADGEPVTALI